MGKNFKSKKVLIVEDEETNNCEVYFYGMFVKKDWYDYTLSRIASVSCPKEDVEDWMILNREFELNYKFEDNKLKLF